jgi:holo-[acyl-carrier protein] synthase
VGLDGWSWKELRYKNGRLWAEGALEGQLADRGVKRLHATVSHEGGIALAVVILEG